MPIIKNAVSAESNKNPILGPQRAPESFGVLGDVFDCDCTVQCGIGTGEIGGVKAESKVRGVTGLLKLWIF